MAGLFLCSFRTIFPNGSAAFHGGLPFLHSWRERMSAPRCFTETRRRGWKFTVWLIFGWFQNRPNIKGTSAPPTQTVC